MNCEATLPVCTSSNLVNVLLFQPTNCLYLHLFLMLDCNHLACHCGVHVYFKKLLTKKVNDTSNEMMYMMFCNFLSEWTIKTQKELFFNNVVLTDCLPCSVQPAVCKQHFRFKIMQVLFSNAESTQYIWKYPKSNSHKLASVQTFSTFCHKIQDLCPVLKGFWFNEALCNFVLKSASKVLSLIEF